MSLENEVLEIIRPTKEESDRISSIEDSLMSKVKDYIRRHNIDVEPRYVGSVAKGTNLGDPDLDLFLMFPTTTPRDTIINIALEMGKELINGRQNYADHPYSTGVYEGLDVDMVPCYKIDSTEHLMTPVDRSPFHAHYVISKCDMEMCDNIRLMKRFMKGIGTYGAEPDVRGFSGYMCELITIHYGGFIKALEAAAKWKYGTVIVMEEKGPKMDAPLVLYDPVDCKRNVASAVHMDTMGEFITAARAYLNKPSIKFFFPEKRRAFSREYIRECSDAHGTRLITVSFKEPVINEDNLHAQVWRCQIGIANKLDLYDFRTVRAVHGIIDGRIVLVFEVERDTLSTRQKRVGPPVWSPTSKGFFDRWAGNPYGEPFIENGNWNIVADRLFSDAQTMLKKEVAIAGIGKDVDPESMIISGHDETLETTDTGLITELLQPKHRWDI